VEDKPMDIQYIKHHGIKGQRWGIRRFQNEDGSLTSQGKKRYNVNADGTTSLKESYRKSQVKKGLLKTAVGVGVAVTGAEKVFSYTKKQGSNLDWSSRSGKKTLNKTIFKAAVASVIIGAGVKNFINANKNKTFNTTGMGGTPEKFEGKPKTRNQVISAQNKLKSKK